MSTDQTLTDQMLPFDEDANSVEVTEVLELDADCFDIGVVVATPDRATDDLFWRTVTRDAMDREWKYGTDEHPELADDRDEYVEARVAAWVRTRISPPSWSWWHRQPNPDWDPEFPHDGENPQWSLVTAQHDTPEAFHGALITPADPQPS